MLTTSQFQTLDDLYAFYNVKMFDAALPECIINLSRRPNSYGFFASNLWAAVDADASPEEETVHEISLNPDYLLRPSINWHQTLVHEMTHLWQHEFGNPSRTAYHNKQWANKMETLGLMPSNTGAPDGARTGQSMTQYIITGGLFETVFNSLDPEELELLRLKFLPVASLAEYDKKKPNDPDGADGDDDGSGTSTTKSKSGTRIKYTCDCGNNVWARSELLILCFVCGSLYCETN
jgi:predicted SprT family Zn-dependent metalloprotease